MSFVKTGLIGHPVSHSKSPAIHNYWIQKYGLSGEFKAIDIPSDNLRSGVQKLVDEGYAGFNVTTPHKQDIFDLCDEVDDTAKAIRAVNTVIIKNGKLSGTNTDAYGFWQNVVESGNKPDFSKGPCVVLGAGGAARAVIHALIGAGADKIIVTNRTGDKARDIRSMDNKILRLAEWEHRSDILKGASFVVNTTSSGMTGKDPLQIDLSQLPQHAVVADIVYAPLMTDLLSAAKGRGNPIVTGIGMLLHQARPAFEKWHGVLPDVTQELQDIVLR